ncbi:MAG: hypothetical protein EBS05_00430 [Proteobacteria bacterium]|nr:hypothetical protein [Pseudomonadota bacterium]
MWFQFPVYNRLHASARKTWKETAISTIERHLADTSWLPKEMALIKAKIESRGEDDGGWFTSDLLVFKNGDWIAYGAKCSKEDIRIHDIFVGRASDGKWYYSTFHFCIGMLDLRVEERPENLSKFITTYSLREFDGHSDECLEKTWPIPKQ